VQAKDIKEEKGGGEVNRIEFQMMISSALKSDPSLLREALNAIAYGMQCAIEDANEKAAQKDIGMLSALCLLRGDRLNDSMKDGLAKRLAESLHAKGTEGLSPIEQHFVDKIGLES
jgi:hypothetical protein